MATAEQLLHEAQYAFNNIGYDDSRDSRRNARRAKSLCRKIIRRYPTGMEAAEAHAMLRRLGEEAYSSRIAVEHRHAPPSTHHKPPQVSAAPEQQRQTTGDVETIVFDWAGLFSLILATPKFVVAFLLVAALFLFSLFGWFLFIPLVIFAAATGPWREPLQPHQRDEMNEFVKRANAWIEERRKSGIGFQ